MQGAFVYDVAGVQRGRWFEENDPAFLVGYGTVLDSAGDHQKLAFFNPHVTVTQLHTEAAFDHQKHFVFIFVVMEDELTFQLVEFYELAVEFGGDVGLLVFRNVGKLLGDVYFFHDVPSVDLSRC